MLSHSRLGSCLCCLSVPALPSTTTWAGSLTKTKTKQMSNSTISSAFYILPLCTYLFSKSTIACPGISTCGISTLPCTSPSGWMMLSPWSRLSTVSCHQGPAPPGSDHPRQRAWKAKTIFTLASVFRKIQPCQAAHRPCQCVGEVPPQAGQGGSSRAAGDQQSKSG